ncbi:hypothetical protein VaNZ11_016023 [Volvox africanus]|uniref:Serine-threonine/tyrosine-protein kinase catalytic domain-containing protein n=1 Tax=Volvox africanus TaxID=51714 RepID=A0ABQ5SMM5_9CHLO|nr:hypothetical protein VaNZ11_016023 [Volvox africanus]
MCGWSLWAHRRRKNSGKDIFRIQKYWPFLPQISNAGAGEKCSGLICRVAVTRLKAGHCEPAGESRVIVAETTVMHKLSHKCIVEFLGVGSTDSSTEGAKQNTMFLVQGAMAVAMSRATVNLALVPARKKLIFNIPTCRTVSLFQSPHRTLCLVFFAVLPNVQYRTRGQKHAVRCLTVAVTQAPVVTCLPLAPCRTYLPSTSIMLSLFCCFPRLC